jgi:hypothetical protein
MLHELSAHSGWLAVCRGVLEHSDALADYARRIGALAARGGTHAAGAVSTGVFVQAMHRAARAGTTPGELLVATYEHTRIALLDCVLCATLVSSPEALLALLVEHTPCRDEVPAKLAIAERVLRRIAPTRYRPIAAPGVPRLGFEPLF